MKPRLLLAAALFALAAAQRGWADSPYTDPWAPATEAAAEAAALRLGDKRALDIVPRVLAIRGLAVRVDGGRPR
jgi:ABC-type sugar transport system substrate-binding protein